MRGTKVKKMGIGGNPEWLLAQTEVIKKLQATCRPFLGKAGSNGMSGYSIISRADRPRLQLRWIEIRSHGGDRNKTLYLGEGVLGNVQHITRPQMCIFMQIAGLEHFL